MENRTIEAKTVICLEKRVPKIIAIYMIDFQSQKFTRVFSKSTLQS